MNFLLAMVHQPWGCPHFCSMGSSALTLERGICKVQLLSSPLPNGGNMPGIAFRVECSEALFSRFGVGLALMLSRTT